MKNYSTSKVFVAACAGMAFFGSAPGKRHLKNLVLRTGIELYMIISKLDCLQAELQAVQPNSTHNLNYRFFR